jgi:hypothetical protein
VDVPAGTAIYEYFTAQSPFDLDNGFVIFTPNAGGGYNVRTLQQTAAPHNAVISGSSGVPAAPTAGAFASRPEPRAAAPSVNQAFANAVVTVRSSGDPKYTGMTNTDAQGNFVLNGVPRGGISVTVTRNGQVIGQGAGVFPGGPFTTQLALSVGLSVPPAPKTAPVVH